MCQNLLTEQGYLIMARGDVIYQTQVRGVTEIFRLRQVYCKQSDSLYPQEKQSIMLVARNNTIVVVRLKLPRNLGL